jgi:hypothetical protein
METNAMPQSQNIEKESVVSPNIFAMPLLIFNLPVDREIIFTDHKKIHKPRIEKRQRKLIVKVTALKFLLQPKELIRCLTTGYSPISVLEQIITGLAFVFFRRAIFIFTNQRILHVRTSFRRRIGNSVSQILYQDCRAIFIKGRALVVCYKSGQREIFNYIGRLEIKKIKALIEELPLQAETRAVFGSRVALCPSCANVLNSNSSICKSCKLKFKSPVIAKWLSLILPGGGYLYCKQVLLGGVAAIAEIAAIAFLIVQWLDFRKGLPLQWSILAAVAGGLVLEKIVTTFHATQMCLDHIPKPAHFNIRNSRSKAR